MYNNIYFCIYTHFFTGGGQNSLGQGRFSSVYNNRHDIFNTRPWQGLIRRPRPTYKCAHKMTDSSLPLESVTRRDQRRRWRQQRPSQSLDRNRPIQVLTKLNVAWLQWSLGELMFPSCAQFGLALLHFFTSETHNSYSCWYSGKFLDIL